MRINNRGAYTKYLKGCYNSTYFFAEKSKLSKWGGVNHDSISVVRRAGFRISYNFSVFAPKGIAYGQHLNYDNKR